MRLIRFSAVQQAPGPDSHLHADSQQHTEGVPANGLLIEPACGALSLGADGHCRDSSRRQLPRPSIDATAVAAAFVLSIPSNWSLSDSNSGGDFVDHQPVVLDAGPGLTGIRTHVVNRRCPSHLR